MTQSGNAVEEAVKVIHEAIEWDGHDSEGVPAVWLDRANNFLANLSTGSTALVVDREAVADIVRKAIDRALRAELDPVLGQSFEYRVKERAWARHEAADAIIGLFAQGIAARSDKTGTGLAEGKSPVGASPCVQTPPDLSSRDTNNVE